MRQIFDASKANKVLAGMRLRLCLVFAWCVLRNDDSHKEAQKAQKAQANPCGTDGCVNDYFVTEGAKLENLVLRVGPAWKARTVSGKVIWQNGRPAAKAYVWVRCGGRSNRLVVADDKGFFSFEIHGEFKYAVEAQVLGPRSTKSDLIEIPEKSTNLTLVLKMN